MLRYDAFERISKWYNPVAADYGLGIESGVIVTLVPIAVLLALSFVIFNRRQIK